MDFLPSLEPLFPSYINKIKKNAADIREYILNNICLEKYEKLKQNPSDVEDLVDACFSNLLVSGGCPLSRVFVSVPLSHTGDDRRRQRDILGTTFNFLKVLLFFLFLFFLLSALFLSFASALHFIATTTSINHLLSLFLSLLSHPFLVVLLLPFSLPTSILSSSLPTSILFFLLPFLHTLLPPSLPSFSSSSLPPQHLTFLLTNLPTYLSTHLLTYLPAYLSVWLPVPLLFVSSSH